uniref:Uncharacterized protein n=1 Tax=Candidatus Kentrum sp. TC TaxID=2126339 RepID=A0A450Y797_9GAMM|nr:MAG: hypothetical protein BECKTC1821D_GA0114238_100149 [Candidatus Kentron sp. TC]
MQPTALLFALFGPLALPLIFWLYRNYKILLAGEGNDEKKNDRLAHDRGRLRAGIEGRKFEARYLHLLGRFLDWLTRFTKDREALAASGARDSWRVRLFGIDPFTEGGYLLCLRLAFFYPVAGFFLGWALGGEGEFSGIEFLPPEEAAWRRWLLLGGTGSFGWLLFKSNRTEGWISLAYSILAVAVAAAAAAAAAFAVAAAAAFAVAAAAAFAVAGAVAFASEWSRDRLRSARNIATYWLGFNLFFVSYLLLAIGWALPRIPDEKASVLLLPVFLGLLPLANAALDWLSLGVTRGLLYAIRRGHHSGIMALAWALADILLAFVFLFAIVSLATGLLAGLNALAFAWGGRTLLDLGALFAGLAREPGAREFWWIHFMMLSTLLPTLAHFFIAGGAAALILPDSWRRWILASFDRSDDARWGAFLYASFVPLLALAAPVGLLWGLYLSITAHHGAVGMALLNWARGIAALLDPWL